MDLKIKNKNHYQILIILDNFFIQIFPVEILLIRVQ